jgi:alpha-mannosidase
VGRRGKKKKKKKEKEEKKKEKKKEKEKGKKKTRRLAQINILLTIKLYFELHRGTYTSQADNKLQNRKNEYALQSLEALCSIGMIHGHPISEAQKSEVDRLWKLLLL